MPRTLLQVSINDKGKNKRDEASTKKKCQAQESVEQEKKDVRDQESLVPMTNRQTYATESQSERGGRHEKKISVDHPSI